MRIDGPSDREEHLLRQILFAMIPTSTAAGAQEPSLHTAPTELLNWRIQKMILRSAIAMTKRSASRLVFSSIS